MAHTTSDQISGWLFGRLPAAWQVRHSEVAVDREEVVLVLTLPDVQTDDDATPEHVQAARAGRATAFREETRSERMGIAREVEQHFGRTLSWGVAIGEHRQLFTHLASPVMTRLRQPQRQVLDTLIEGGIARSRSEALAWCVRLVAQHEDEWLTELRDAMAKVAEVRAQGPAA